MAVSSFTFDLPYGSDEVDRYLRALAPELVKLIHELRRACLDKHMRLLLPINEFSDPNSLTKLGGMTFMGLPIELADVNEPMVGSPIKATHVPDHYNRFAVPIYSYDSPSFKLPMSVV